MNITITDKNGATLNTEGTYIDENINIILDENLFNEGENMVNGLTLFSTWTGETNAGGLKMSQDCVDTKLYLVNLGYALPEDTGGFIFGQGIFRAGSELEQYSWAKFELHRTDDASVSTVYETLYATWCPSLGGPAAIHITGYNKLSDTNVVMCNLYQLD